MTAGRIEPSRAALLCALVVLSLAGCRAGGPRSLDASATDLWTRSYSLAPGGDFQIVGGQGAVEIEGTDGGTVEVKVERMARAATEATAKDVAPRIEIREDVTPEKIVLQTKGLGGIVIGVETVVNYRVTVPAGTNVRVRNANGPITIRGVTGRVVLSSANGQITGRSLGGGVDARATNQSVSIDLAAFGEHPVDVRSTNGSATLTLPATADAILTATSVNGKIDVASLSLEPIGEQTLRRVRGRLNAGGPPIEIHAVNGSVHVTTRP